MTKTTKRSNAEIADSCISASEDWAAARSNQTLCGNTTRSRCRAS